MRSSLCAGHQGPTCVKRGGCVAHVSVNFLWTKSPEFVAGWWPERGNQFEQREKERRHTELRVCRLLLLHLTVGFAVDLSDCTHERRKLFLRVYSLCAAGRLGRVKQHGVSSESGGENQDCLWGFFDTTWQRSRSAAAAAYAGCARFFPELFAEKVWNKCRKESNRCFNGYAGGMKTAARHRRPFQRFCCCGVGLVAVIWLAQVIQAPGETLI